MKIKLLATLVATIFLSACSSTMNVGESTFACKEEQGCPTPIEVYNKTHRTPKELLEGKTPNEWKANGKEVVKIPDITKQTVNQEVLSAKRIEVDTERIVSPLRRGSQVARIWVAPWVDENDRLHWSRYIFVEVSPRRWQFGERDLRNSQAVPFVESQSDFESGLPLIDRSRQK